MLQKRRGVSLCRVCGKRVRGLDHAACKTAKESEVAAFRTPAAHVLSKREHATILRKPFTPSKDKRAKRVGRKRRKHKGTVVSDAALKDLQSFL